LSLSVITLNPIPMKPNISNTNGPAFVRGYNWAKKLHESGTTLYEISQLSQGFSAFDRGAKKYVAEAGQ
jgi:hypothetical protein